MASAPTTLGTIHGSIDLRFNDSDPQQVCTFELPVTASVLPGVLDQGVVLELTSDAHPIKSALAARLREIADSLESGDLPA